MEELGNNMEELLKQVHLLSNQVVAGDLQKDAFLKQLRDLLGHYSDLNPDHYKKHIENAYYDELMELLREPAEKELWMKIEKAPLNTLAEVEAALLYVLDYINRYPTKQLVRQADSGAVIKGYKANDAKDKKVQLESLRSRLLEEDDWTRLDKNNYLAMRNYRQKYPNSVHMMELDDLMWNSTNQSSKDELNRYLGDWRPSGRHVAEAETLIAGYLEWENLQMMLNNNPKEDVFKLVGFIKKYPNHPVMAEANKKFHLMRSAILDDMRTNAGSYQQADLDKFINEGVFTRKELIDAGLIGGEFSGPKIELPNLAQFTAYANYEATPGCTDVYLMGVPGSGKTCLLMGLMGSDGTGYSVNFMAKGGPYASALNLYLKAGAIPTTTPGKFVTTIRSTVEEKGKKGEIMNHEINFVEMSGEEFARKIANNDETVSLNDMGDGAKNLLRNNNRKVFLLIVDPTRDIFNFTYDEPVYDTNGNMIGVNPGKILVDQTACLAKFISLFEMPENKEFMKNVDAIHFIVTKSDTLGRSDQERKERARDLLLEKYRGPISNLIAYCRRSKRVNYATDFKPKAYPFSLGQFFVGGSFKYNNDSTLKTIDTLRHITAAKKEGNFWDDLRDKLA